MRERKENCAFVDTFTVHLSLLIDHLIPLKSVPTLSSRLQRELLDRL